VHKIKRNTRVLISLFSTEILMFGIFEFDLSGNGKTENYEKGNSRGSFMMSSGKGWQKPFEPDGWNNNNNKNNKMSEP